MVLRRYLIVIRINWISCMLLFAAGLVLGGCASTHNLKTDGNNLLGGGFHEEELRPGLFKLTARSNQSIWPNFSAAHTTWTQRADQLCGKQAYKSFDADFSDGQGSTLPIVVPGGGMVGVTNYNATLSGYLVCDSAQLTITEAKSFLRQQALDQERRAAERHQQELLQLGGDDCSQAAPSITSEIYFQRARALRTLEQYTKAKACYFLAQQIEKDTSSYYYRESCEALGWMYELGYGVEKDMQTAREWYRKAGLL
ncbi:MAG: hypothetical protein A2Z93_15750 [Curvibacter sp. GWA2_64_110]|nr:MAG: hypothetical protein A2Z93_15750 [Curvibacter sp. GWA2_64_110]